MLLIQNEQLNFQPCAFCNTCACTRVFLVAVSVAHANHQLTRVHSRHHPPRAAVDLIISWSSVTTTIASTVHHQVRPVPRCVCHPPHHHDHAAPSESHKPHHGSCSSRHGSRTDTRSTCCVWHQAAATHAFDHVVVGMARNPHTRPVASCPRPNTTRDSQE